MTQKELTNVIRQHESKDGSPSQFSLPCGATVEIESVYISGTGPHRAWKYLYYLRVDGKRLGGYDRRDSFVAWASGKLNERPECRHCSKPAVWTWKDADGNESANICQNCMDTAWKYQEFPLWQFAPIAAKEGSLCCVCGMNEARLGSRKCDHCREQIEPEDARA